MWGVGSYLPIPLPPRSWQSIGTLVGFGVSRAGRLREGETEAGPHKRYLAYTGLEGTPPVAPPLLRALD